jgi:hypothetical protein
MLQVYPDSEATMNELQKLGAILFFNVDATRLRETLIPQYISILKQRGISATVNSDQTLQNHFHRVLWNFPCEAVRDGQDGQNQAMEQNKLLVRNFVSNVQHYLYICKSTDTNSSNNRGNNGEIHITHKTKVRKNTKRQPMKKAS